MGSVIGGVVEKAKSMGAEFRVDEGQVLVRGLSLLPEALREELQSHKMQVLAYIASKSHEAPIIWHTGDTGQIRSLLVLREAELILAKSQLTGNDWVDWYLNNRITSLEIQIGDLQNWLSQAMEKE